MAESISHKDEQIARLEATVMALQDQAFRFTQLAQTAVGQLQELKAGKKPQRKKITDWKAFMTTGRRP